MKNNTALDRLLEAVEKDTQTSIDRVRSLIRQMSATERAAAKAEVTQAEAFGGENLKEAMKEAIGLRCEDIRQAMNEAEDDPTAENLPMQIDDAQCWLNELTVITALMLEKRTGLDAMAEAVRTAKDRMSEDKDIKKEDS